jgi:hypothetical protein
MDKTGRSMNERRVAVLSMMETSTSASKSSHQVIESWQQSTRPYNGNETGRSVKEGKVAVLSMMETSTSVSLSTET